MAISRVGSESTINTSAASSVVVDVPADVQDGDLLLAFVGLIGQVAITAPDGWTLEGTRDAGANVRVACYRRWADASEPDDYRWKFSAYKNWAVIAAYRGVDPDDPVDASSGTSSSGTSHTSPSVTAVSGDWLATAVCARHSFTGSTTTWSTGTGTDSELFDGGSNAGSGVDISGAVYDSNTTVSAGAVSRTLTSSQSESQIGLWSVLLHAAPESGGSFDTGASVTNGTAGTSVTVTKPAGTADGDLLVAVIAEAGTGAITAPAGWTLAGDATAGTSLRSAIYWKIASSEGASWTWTLASSARNWGWAANYTNADTTDPLLVRSAVYATGTSYTTPTAEVLDPSRWLGAVAAVRTASGAATTWTGSGSERFDGSTNAGSGTDIAGAVYEATSLATRFHVDVTASQEQSYAILWSIGIQEPFTSPTFPLDVVVEAAFGADPDGDLASATWTDITTSVRYDDGVTIRVGRPNESSFANPAAIELTLRNPDGHFTPENPASTYYPHVVRNLPLRVSVDGVGVNPPYVQAVGFVDSWAPDWDTSASQSMMQIVASGRLRRLQQGDTPLKSAMYRCVSGQAGNGIAPQAYWPCEDGSGAGQAASATGGTGMGATGTVTFAGDSTLNGSEPVPTLANGARLAGTVPTYTDTGQWCVVFAVKVAASVASTTTLATITATGALRTWQIRLVAGSPDSLQVRVLDSSGTQVFTDSITLTEATFYGNWNLISIGAVTADPDVGYVLQYFNTTDSGAATGFRTSTTVGVVRNLNVAAASTTDGMAVGHIAVITDLGFDLTTDPEEIAAALDGHTGETPATRFTRLCAEEGVPSLVVDATDPGTDTTMGPQDASTFVGALRDCEIVDGGTIHDGGPNGELVFTTRQYKYNAFPTLTLDTSAGQLAPPFEPQYDDQQIRNDVTVARTSGSSARLVDEDHVAANGRYEEKVTLPVADDSQLYPIAGWRVHQGTTPGYRYPQLNWDLRATPDKTREALTVKVGSRLAVTDLPSQHPPDDVDVFVEGYRVVLDPHRWRITGNCSPGSPFDVAVLEAADDSAFRLDTDGAELTAAVTSGATSLLVASTGDDMWTTASADFPLDVEIGGEQITLSAIATATVTLVAAGTAAVSGNAAGTETLAPALPAGLTAGDLLLVLASIRNSGTGTVTTPDGYTLMVDHSNFRLYGKYATSSENAPTISFSDGVANATILAQTAAFRGASLEVVASATTTNASAANISYPALGVPENNCLILYLGWRQQDWTSVTSPGTEIGEPDSGLGDNAGQVWAYQVQTTATDISSGSFTVSGGVNGIGKGATLALRPTQTFTVSARSVNGVTKAHDAGASVRLHQPHVLAL